MSDIFDGGGVGATAPADQFGGLLSQPPLSPAVEPPVAPPPTPSEPEPAPAEPEANAPGMLERKLLQFGLVTMDQLGEAMREEAVTGRPVAGILVDRGWISQEQVAQLLEPPPPAEVAPTPIVVAVAELPPEPAPEPTVLVEAPPEPVALAPPIPEPVVEIVPVPAPEPVPAAPEPVPAAPEPEPAPIAQVHVHVPPTLDFHVYIRLSTGERIDAGTFAELDHANAHAQSLVDGLAGEGRAWPHVGGRYLRPEAIVSIDVEAVPV